MAYPSAKQSSEDLGRGVPSCVVEKAVGRGGANGRRGQGEMEEGEGCSGVKGRFPFYIIPVKVKIRKWVLLKKQGDGCNDSWLKCSR